MQPPTLLRAPTALAATMPRPGLPMANRIPFPVLRRPMSTFQLSTQRVLDYLVETLRNVW